MSDPDVTSGRAPLRHRLKPAASRRAHVTTAAALWTLVGLGLAAAGTRWTVLAARGLSQAMLLALALAVGAAKGRFVLARTARKAVARIDRRGEGRCLGGFLSWRGWLLALLMMAMGRALRHSGVPHSVLGPLYLAVGVALLVGSRVFWRARLRRRPPAW